MTETNISIGQVKRDISELVNRVAYGKERIILTSRGKPKAAGGICRCSGNLASCPH